MMKKPALAVGQIWYGRGKPQYAISARRILAIEGTRVTWEPVGSEVLVVTRAAASDGFGEVD